MQNRSWNGSEELGSAAVTSADFDTLVELRIAAMRESLERLGRFDPDRARERLRNSFHPEHTFFILLKGEKVGFYTFRPEGNCLHVDHFYIHPHWQGRGVGSRVLALLFLEADKCGWPIRLGALKQSRSNEFYRRHGFIQVGESEWDIFYERLSTPCN